MKQEGKEHSTHTRPLTPPATARKKKKEREDVFAILASLTDRNTLSSRRCLPVTALPCVPCPGRSQTD